MNGQAVLVLASVLSASTGNADEGMLQQSLQDNFESADRNRDGRLSINELQRAVHEPAVLLRGR